MVRPAAPRQGHHAKKGQTLARLKSAPIKPPQLRTVIVIIKQGHWELIAAPQDPTQAWELADRLTSQTGIPHTVGKI